MLRLPDQLSVSIQSDPCGFQLFQLLLTVVVSSSCRFDDQEMVALSGAHALGRCHPDRSGWDGPWTNAPTTFSNEYFVQLFENKWCVFRTV